jgi:hypothetical protein
MKQPIFNAGPAILFALMTAFIAGLSWALHWLPKGMEFSNFMIFGVLGIAAMVSCGYAWDYLSAGAASDHGNSKTI